MLLQLIKPAYAFFMLPLGVVIPTKNSMHFLPLHLQELAAWIELAAEVVVVDSFSTDGTMEYLQKNLRHPHVKFLQHPPGLYASWNFGIGQLRSEFCYISTVGDAITRKGIEHLTSTAARLGADVLVSCPDFLNAAGEACAGPRWPMAALISRLKLSEPACLPPAIVIATALTETDGALTGSCASDIFRTSVLQKNPFPLEFGVAGDGAWSLLNAVRLNWAVTPERVSKFRIHESTASPQELAIGDKDKQFEQLSAKVVLEWLETEAQTVSPDDRDDIRRLLALTTEYADVRRRDRELRKSQGPWIFKPSAWQLRSSRHRLKSQVDELAQKICNRMGAPVSPFQPRWLARSLASFWIRFGKIKEQKYRATGWESYAERMQFKLDKARLRFSSKSRVGDLHRLADDLRSARTFNRYAQTHGLNPPSSATGEVTFKHSGNAGDIIYALPAMRALSQERQAKLFLKLDVPLNGWSEKQHPLGKSGLTSEMVLRLKPLLEHQTWIAPIQIHHDEPVDFDLDLFRQVPNTSRGLGNIAHWYFWLFGASADLSQPWLQIASPAPASKKILIARSARYHNPGIHYGFLRTYGAMDFVGTKSEFEEMQQGLPELRHVECADFLEMARTIQSARFFIGNQSFPYAVAEALKVPRILEVCPQHPDVIPVGGKMAEAFFQPNFKKLVREFWEQTA